MKKTVAVMLGVSLIFIGSVAFAADNAVAKKDGKEGFEQKKAEVLSHIDERIARLQHERECVNGTKNHEDLKACKEKFKVEKKDKKPKDANPGM